MWIESVIFWQNGCLKVHSKIIWEQHDLVWLWIIIQIKTADKNICASTEWSWWNAIWNFWDKITCFWNLKIWFSVSYSVKSCWNFKSSSVYWQDKFVQYLQNDDKNYLEIKFLVSECFLSFFIDCRNLFWGSKIEKFLNMK